MRIAYITAGAAGRLCGNCLRDNALARALNALGDDATLISVYTPIRTDETDVSERRVFFNGLRVWLAEKHRYFRSPRPVLDRVLGARPLLALLSRMTGGGTDPRVLGDLTISMLRGEDGHQRKELDELVRFLRDEIRPDVIHLTNILLIGMARALRAELDVPIVCGLQAEDAYIDFLPEAQRADALALISERARGVDALVAVSEYYADEAARRFTIERPRIDVVLSGIAAASFTPTERVGGRPLTLGYFARLSPDKGFELLCDAFVELDRRGYRDLRLELAGFVAGEWRGAVAARERALRRLGLGSRVRFRGTLDLAEKLAFFRGVDVFSVPTLRPEPKGLFALEAMAAGVPIVVPRHGVFPELIDATGGGILVDPGSRDGLASGIAALLDDASARQQIGAAGRAAVLGHFTTERMAIETRAVYQRVLDAR